jgi:hypothetical protein
MAVENGSSAPAPGVVGVVLCVLFIQRGRERSGLTCSLVAARPRRGARFASGIQHA